MYKKKAKKHKKRASGMDFCSSGKKKKNQSSRDASRAGTPEKDAGNSNEENGGGKVSYALDNVVAESKGWVLDKGAGETILVRSLVNDSDHRSRSLG